MATKLDGAAGNEAPRSKAQMLKHALQRADLAFVMEAHNGLSAKVVEEAGFEGIWASGLAMSAALGVRDNNEASWTQVLEQLEFMADATQIPILVDGDTGHGNFNNVRRLVKKLCQRGIAGVCIEDKLFPKTNSFIGEGQPLADIDEFAGRIKAGKDSQDDADFQLIARVEALISGWGMEEALRRAEAYRAAGADGILIHSKKADAEEILTFSREWAGRAPLVIVPTMYYTTPTDAFRDAAVSLVIWANHNLRAALSAMRDTSRRIMEEQSLTSVEGKVASVKEIFQIVGQNELAAAEARYLKPKGGDFKGIILAASRGTALGPLTERMPKCMLDIRGQPLLKRLVTTLTAGGLRDISVVRGYRKEMIDLANIRVIDNDAFATNGEAASLECAADQLDGACVLSYGDILFRPYILENLLASSGDITAVIDARWRGAGHRAAERNVDLAVCSRPFTGDYLDEEPVWLEAVRSAGEKSAENGEPAGEFIGLIKLSAAGALTAREELATMKREEVLDDADLPTLLNRLIARGVRIETLYVTGHWLDVDDAFDLAKARNLV
ncbi:MAG: phosphoenolpyruvate mutase [Proteobacteria bacterium]|nr:phosphoenolpyruvate mutase [Pseudomonadota bacterium]MDA1357755.1 phosphoenolpyruvate mutase [Pseudomonadota bacterium]